VAIQPKRIKILYTIPNFDTAGSGKALLNIATRLPVDQFEVEVLCQHTRGMFFETLRASGVLVHVADYTHPMRPLVAGLRHCWQLSRILKRLAPDIIHSFHYAPDYSEPLAARLAGIPWVYTKKNMNWGGASANAWRLRSWLARAIVAQNRQMLSDFFPHSKKVHLIPRGLDVEKYKPQEGSNPPPMSNLITVANLAPVKNIELLLEALEMLLRVHPWLRLVVVGDDANEYGTRLRGVVHDRKLDQAVTFVGKQADPLPFLQNAAVFVLPSRKESSPVALLEAMACGVPVVATRTAGALEMMGDWPEQLIPLDDPGAMASCIQRLLDLSETNRKSIIARQRQRIEERHLIELEMQRHVKMYRTLCWWFGTGLCIH